MNTSTNRRTVKLELPNGLVRMITLRAARHLLRKGHACFVGHHPMIVRLHVWALPHYRMLFFWGIRSDGNSMAGGGFMHNLPHKRERVDLDAEPPEKWVELDRLEKVKRRERQAALKKLMRKEPAGTTPAAPAAGKTVRAKKRIMRKELCADV